MTKDIEWRDARWRYGGNEDDVAMYGDGRPVLLVRGKEVDDAQLLRLIHTAHRADDVCAAMRRAWDLCRAESWQLFRRRWWQFLVPARRVRALLARIEEALEPRAPGGTL